MDLRLHEMADHHEIRKVPSLYCDACDRTDAKLMGSIYAEGESYDDHWIVNAPEPVYSRDHRDF